MDQGISAMQKDMATVRNMKERQSERIQQLENGWTMLLQAIEFMQEAV